MVALKKKYPDRVVLLLGNRDLNKLRLTSELEISSKYYRLELVEGPAWVPPNKRVPPDLFLRRLLAKELDCAPEEVPSEAVEEADTLPNRIRWMYKETSSARRVRTATKPTRGAHCAPTRRRTLPTTQVWTADKESPPSRDSGRGRRVREAEGGAGAASEGE